MIAVDDLIQEACARNTAAELLYRQRDGTTVVGQVRLMEWTTQEILADRPMYADGKRTIPPQAEIMVHFSVRGERYQFQSEIIDAFRQVRLNAHQTVPGIALQTPQEITASQRRAHLRISTAGYEPISISLVKPHPTILDACPVWGPVVPGWVVDLAIGGLAVVADPRVYRAPARGDQFFVTYNLPTVDHDFNMIVVLRHWRTVPRNDSLRLGLAFVPWQPRQFRIDQQRLARFVAAHERRMLRRRK